LFLKENSLCDFLSSQNRYSKIDIFVQTTLEWGGLYKFYQYGVDRILWLTDMFII